ncbi:MAG: hypothetical protein L0Z50_30580 [Verrucomicrobiales bacterium]|nr:hypothetical protein [Verrucomicrobiales bacterium]
MLARIKAQSSKRSEPISLRPFARDILAYLSEHPGAQDTLEGIVEWWLLERRIQRVTREVKTTLDDLVARALVTARHGLDGRVYYKANLSGNNQITKGMSDLQAGSNEDDM